MANPTNLSNNINNVPNFNTSHVEKHGVNAQKMRRAAIVLSAIAVGLIAAGGAVLGPQLVGHLGNMNWVYAGPGIGVAVLGLGIAAFAINQAVKASRPHKDLTYDELAEIVKSNPTETQNLSDVDFKKLQGLSGDAELQKILARDDRMTGDQLLNDYNEGLVSVGHMSKEQYQVIVDHTITKREDVSGAVNKLFDCVDENSRLDGTVFFDKIDLLANHLSTLTEQESQESLDLTADEIKCFARDPYYFGRFFNREDHPLYVSRFAILAYAPRDVYGNPGIFFQEKYRDHANEIANAGYNVENDWTIFMNAHPTDENIKATINEDVDNAVAHKMGREAMFKLHQSSDRPINEGDIDALVKWFAQATVDEAVNEAVEFLDLLPSESEVTQAIISQSLDTLKSLQQLGDEDKVIKQLARHPEVMIKTLLAKPKAQFISEDFELMYAVFDTIPRGWMGDTRYNKLVDDVKMPLENWDVEDTGWMKVIWRESNATLKGLVEGLEKAHETRQSKDLQVVSESYRMPKVIKDALDKSTKFEALQTALGRDTPPDLDALALS